MKSDKFETKKTAPYAVSAADIKQRLIDRADMMLALADRIGTGGSPFTHNQKTLIREAFSDAINEMTISLRSAFVSGDSKYYTHTLEALSNLFMAIEKL